MSYQKIKYFLERQSDNLQIGQFGRDWIEIELDKIEERERLTGKGFPDDEATFCHAIHYAARNLLDIMTEHAPCRPFFEELEILSNLSLNAAEHNSKLLKHWAKYPPEKPVINYGGRH